MYFRNAGLKFLPEGLLAGMTQLASLYLAGNQFSQVKDLLLGTLAGIKQLTSLVLAGNHFLTGNIFIVPDTASYIRG